MPLPSVVIVGAGLAGLAAARELERRGCGVIVVEARATASAVAYGPCATASAACTRKRAAI